MRPSKTTLLIATTGLLFAAGCASKSDGLIAPRAIIAPYNTGGSEVLWAVAPLRNESGTTTVDPGQVSDALVTAVEEVRGVRSVPMNRTLAATRALGMTGIKSPADARSLAAALGVDAVVAGSITSFDPYAPSIGLALAVFPRPGSNFAETKTSLSPRELQTMTVDPASKDGTVFSERPVAVISEHWSANDHQVLMDLKSFGEGRSDTQSALGWRRYTASSALFSEFAAYRAVDGLMRQETIRLGRVGPINSGTRNASASDK
jgi:hypothetical protein